MSASMMGCDKRWRASWLRSVPMPALSERETLSLSQGQCSRFPRTHRRWTFDSYQLLWLGVLGEVGQGGPWVGDQAGKIIEGETGGRSRGDNCGPLKKRQPLFSTDFCIWMGSQNPDDDTSTCLELPRPILLQTDGNHLVPLPRLSSTPLILPSDIFPFFSPQELSRITSVLDSSRPPLPIS
jgi:hypothetical protein